MGANHRSEGRPPSCLPPWRGKEILLQRALSGWFIYHDGESKRIFIVGLGLKLNAKFASAISSNASPELLSPCLVSVKPGITQCDPIGPRLRL